MPDSPDIFDDVANAYLGNSTAPKPPKGPDVAGTLDDEFSNLGYTPAARLSILGDVGRENGWNPHTIFNGHSDPANGKFNRGIISWQGDRQQALDDYLKQQGVYGKGDDSELRGMARFMDSELQSKYPKAYGSLKNADNTRQASSALQGYIKYNPSAPYNSPDPDFMVKNNRDWAMKAQKLGLGQDQFQGAANAYLNQPEADPFDAAASAYLDNQGPAKTVKGLPSPNPIPEPQQTLQTPPSLADTQPQPTVPESIPTIMSQISSANALDSPRSAVLLTDPTQLTAFSKDDLRGLQPVKTPNGILLVNPEKAKAAGINDIPSYVQKNGFANLIGKVEDNPDTTTGLALRTEDAQGNELSTSKVSPSAIHEQAHSDLQQFPNAAKQEVVNAQDAVQLRQGDLNKQLNTLNAIGQASANQQRYVQPTVKQLVPKPQQAPYSESDFRAWAGYNKLPMNAATRKTFEGQLASSANDQFGKGVTTDASINNAPVQQGQNINGVTVYDNRESGKQNDNSQGAEYSAIPVNAKSDEDASRQALIAVGSKYGITPQEVDAFMQRTKGQGARFVEGSGYKQGKEIDVPLSVLRQISPDKVQDTVHTQQVQNRQQAPDLSVNPNTPEFMDEVNSDAGKALAAVNPLFLFLPEETRNKVAGTLLSGAVQSSGGVVRSLAGLADIAEFDQRAFEDVAGKPPEGRKLSDLLKDWASADEQASTKLGYTDNSWRTLILKTVGGAPIDLAKFALLTRLPGGIIVGMAADSALQSKGRGEDMDSVIKQAAKGAVLGSVMHFAPLGGAVIKGVTRGVVPEVAGEALTNLAGTKIASSAFGDDADKSDEQAMMAALFGLATHGVKLFGKTVKAEGKNGTTEAYVDPNGDVRLLKGDTLTTPDVEINTQNADKSSYEAGQLPAPKLPRLGESNVDQYSGQGDVTEPLALPPGKERGNPIANPNPSPEPIPAPDSSIEAQRIPEPDPKAVSALQTDSRVQAILKNLEPGKTYTTDEVRTLVNKNSGKRFNQGAIDQALLSLYGAQALETLPGNRVRILTEADVKPNDIHELAKNYGQTPPAAEVPKSPAPLAKNENVSVPEVSTPEAVREVRGNEIQKAEPTDLKTELRDAYKKGLELPLLNPEKAFHRAKLTKPVKVTYETESGKRFTKEMPAAERQRQIESKGKALQKLIDCIHG